MKGSRHIWKECCESGREIDWPRFHNSFSVNHNHELKLCIRTVRFDETLCEKSYSWQTHGFVTTSRQTPTSTQQGLGSDLNKHTCQNFIRYRAGLQLLWVHYMRPGPLQEINNPKGRKWINLKPQLLFVYVKIIRKMHLEVLKVKEVTCRKMGPVTVNKLIAKVTNAIT